jgi:hypothetical protein
VLLMETERRLADRRGRRSGDMTPERVGPTFVRTYLQANVFEFCLAIAAMLAGIWWALDPSALHNSTVGERSGVLVYVWAVSYVVAGLMIAAGMLRATHDGWWRMELGGLRLLGSAMLAQAAVILVEHGARGIASTITYLTLAAAAFVRGRVIVTLTGARR